ncbi:hypothetical protein [Cytobacillus sp. NCCP-133]|uniref:hypothetical protein n=1 Tax=Cytobacillus sp. NCCP-133 TaxID=766848 RepID=UPI002230A0A9|nr:hypothetical protein [Cytobacillus sp. NCCP-133]GLB61419.1 hypothetical protein NCCP133_35490 [Cytobacillus sp. NCCP-133]
MDFQNNDHIVETVISLIEVLVIISIEEIPYTGIALAILLKTVTHDRLIRILLILMVIVLAEIDL